LIVLWRSLLWNTRGEIYGFNTIEAIYSKVAFRFPPNRVTAPTITAVVVMRYFEEIVVAVIFVTAFIGTYFIEEVSLILNFYYLPVLVGSFFLGRRIGILIALLSILDVLICAMLFPHRFFADRVLWHSIVKLASWSVFLFLASVTVGTLYEKNERRLQDLKKAYIGILEILAKYLESTDRYTKGHSVRVSEFAMEIAIAMELPRSQVDNIRAAGLLHDIGRSRSARMCWAKRLP